MAPRHCTHGIRPRTTANHQLRSRRRVVGTVTGMRIGIAGLYKSRWLLGADQVAASSTSRSINRPHSRTTTNPAPRVLPAGFRPDGYSALRVLRDRNQVHKGVAFQTAKRGALNAGNEDENPPWITHVRANAAGPHALGQHIPSMENSSNSSSSSSASSSRRCCGSVMEMVF
jgi:hypothetical protein